MFHILVVDDDKNTRMYFEAVLKNNGYTVSYDPGASEVNQLNRIKLMLSAAKERMQEKEACENKELDNSHLLTPV